MAETSRRHTTDARDGSASSDDRSCASILLETLRSQPGLRGITIESSRGELKLRYDPERVSQERIEAVARELREVLIDSREHCEHLGEGRTCGECPEFLEDQARGLESVRWLQSPGAGRWRVGVEFAGPQTGLRDLSIETRRLRPAVQRWFSLRGLLAVLPVVLCGTLLAAGWILDFLGAPGPLVLYLLSCVAGGLPTAWSTLQSIRERRLDVDFLMLLGASGAAILGHFDESAMLLFLFTLSSALESFAMGRTRRAVESLMALRPDEATVLRDGRPHRVSVEAVEIGERIAVKPGERVPLDGRVVEGEADVDESVLTGESLPRGKGPGASLLSGSINLNGSLVVEVTRAARESTLSRVVELVEEARETRAPTQRVFDDFAKYYVFLILLAAASTAILPPVLGKGSWSDMFYRSMIVLVVASPCALVISTPATLLSAIAAAARRGILLKGGAVVERLGRATAVAFDKTGTLTDGTLVVEAVESQPGIGEDELLALAAAAEQSSEHVVARGIVEEARRRGLPDLEAESFRAHPGLGVEVRIADQRVLVGNERFLEREGLELAQEEWSLGRDPGVGKAVWVARGESLAGRIYLRDRLRREVPAVVRKLAVLGIRRVAMLTGDEERVAVAVGREAGIDDLRSELLPDEKVRETARLSDEGEVCVMVGDGVNDAPAMAASSVGVAMGAAGTDVALEAADAVLMSSDLVKLTEAIELCRRALRILYANLFFASAVIVVLVTLAFTGGLALPVGVAGHEGSTLLVVLNGLRLLGWKPG